MKSLRKLARRSQGGNSRRNLRQVFSLTRGTIEGTAFASQSPDTSAAAVRARLAFLPVHKMSLLVPSLCSIRGKEIPHAGAPISDSLFQHFPHGSIQPLGGRPAQPVGRSIGVKAGTKQDFVRIDVADAGNHLLVHQKRLEPPAASVQETNELFLRHVQRIEAKPPGDEAVQPLSIQQVDPSEPPGIPVAHLWLRSIVQIQREMGMLGKPLAGCPEQEAPGHPELPDDVPSFLTARQRKHHAFASPFHRGNPGAAIPSYRGQAFPHDVRAAHPTVLDAGAYDPASELTGGDFRFRQFRHEDTGGRSPGGKTTRYKGRRAGSAGISYGSVDCLCFCRMRCTSRMVSSRLGIGAAPGRRADTSFTASS